MGEEEERPGGVESMAQSPAPAHGQIDVERPRKEGGERRCIAPEELHGQKARGARGHRCHMRGATALSVDLWLVLERNRGLAWKPHVRMQMMRAANQSCDRARAGLSVRRRGSRLWAHCGAATVLSALS